MARFFVCLFFLFYIKPTTLSAARPSRVVQFLTFCAFSFLRLMWLIAVVVACVSAAPRPHHPHGRPGHRHEAWQHPGVRHARKPPGAGRRRLRLVRQSRHVAAEEPNGGRLVFVHFFITIFFTFFIF